MPDSQEARLGPLIARVAEATSCFMRGDMRRYFELIQHADDFTLMPPYGEVRRGTDDSEATIDGLTEWFQGGEAELEIILAETSGDLAVIIGVERQRGVVGGLPEQDWSLRVTLIFRREGSGWLLMHRHADALTHPIGHDLLAALARGDADGQQNARG
jgi:ketosteroid isomerase-like protein